MQSKPTSWTRRRFLRDVAGASAIAMVAGAEAHGETSNGSVPPFVLENEVLRISVAPADASIMVLDKRNNLTWHQQVQKGFSLSLSEQSTAKKTSLSVKVIGPDGSYPMTISLNPDRAHEFELLLEVPDKHYAVFPGYPFPFAAPQKTGWHFVQNTTGEGILMPMDKFDDIKKPFDFGSSQPWWGLTDLKSAMRARLETFKFPSGKDDTVYASPLRISYAFFTEGGYVGLAKEYRKDFLHAHPEMQPLASRTKDRPATGHLKDAVYVYFWGKTPAEDLKIAQEMKAAGIDRAIAVCYGRHEIDRARCDGMKELGWVVGRYQMPTGNLFQVSKKFHWPAALLTGKLDPKKFFATSHHDAWDRICGKQVLKAWPEKLKAQIDDYGLQLLYYDTLVCQMAPCVHPDHPQTIEENQQSRYEILQKTREMGMVVGSGEGANPTWALPALDFFEGAMGLRTYSDIQYGVVEGGYAREFTLEEYKEQASTVLDEKRRIPLYQLAFHDYVGSTWVWRDTNFQCTPYAWKKNLFNLLYGTMPMWHISASLWALHKDEMIASYQQISSVRKRIGFAEMVNHGWLTTDRSVQFTDWSNGDRVIVNFGDHPWERPSKEPVVARSFAIEKRED